MRIRLLHIILTISVLIGWLPYLNGQPMTRIDSLTATVRIMPDNEQKLNILHDICAQHNNVDTVLTYAEMMHTIARKLGNYQAGAHAHQYIGWCYGNLGDYKKALTNHYRALIVYDSIADSVGMAKCYIAAGEDFLDLKDYYSADEYFHKALDIYNSLGLESETSSIYRNLGSMYKDYKLFETAKQYFKSAIELDEKYNSTQGLIIDYDYLASTEYDEYHEFNDQNSIIMAKMLNDMSYKNAVELNDSTYLYYVIQNSLPIYLDYAKTLDDSARRQHLLDSCVPIYHSAMTFCKNNGYYANYYMLENCRAKHLLLNHLYQDCLDQLEKVKNNPYDSLNQYFSQQIDYDCYIDCYVAMGNYQKALEYKKLKDISESPADYLETTLNSSKSSMKEEFEQLLRQQDKERINRELLFNEHKKMIRIINMSTVIFILLLITFAVVAFFEIRAKKRNNKIMMSIKDEHISQRNMLTTINIQITDGIRYAKGIQSSSIPSEKIMNSIFGESLVIWKPLDIVSGNFYWARQKGRYKLLAVADCLRHGVPGAFTSMLGITTLNDIASSEITDTQCPTASEILDKLRAKIEKCMPESGMSEPANIIDIALCIIDSESNSLQFAGAHNPVMIIRNGYLKMLKSDNFHVGDPASSNNRFTNTEVDLNAGDVIYLYTDGIASQLNSKWNDSAGILSELLTTIYYLPLTEQTEYINYALSKSPKSQEIIDQTDDILLVGIRIGEATKEG